MAFKDHAKAGQGLVPAARWVRTNFSRSWEGPAPETVEVKISTESPDCRFESSGTNRPLIRAPMHEWPTSVWTA